mmetsp:Transcript_67574/g.209033  ORF Transcript_67574/g.209033 Transcript_67574/m.209033 type:complete len:81 (+) Transcript_67574:670-912(+)
MCARDEGTGRESTGMETAGILAGAAAGAMVLTVAAMTAGGALIPDRPAVAGKGMEAAIILAGGAAGVAEELVMIVAAAAP